jgi:predicted nucleic acid-binding protein
LAGTALADTGFLVGLLRQRDRNTEWAAAQAAQFLPPWRTCEAVLAEAFHLLGPPGAVGLIALLRRDRVLVSFELAREQEPVLSLMQKYAEVPMSLADACLVRMTETHADPIILTTDANFRIYRRHSRQVVPCVMPD